MAGNHTVIKRYTDNYYCVMQLKVTKSKPRKSSLLPFDAEYLEIQLFPPFSFPTLEIDNFYSLDLPDVKILNEKLGNHLSRARTNIFELAMCNGFDMFATFTVSPEKYDRYHLKAYYKDFGQYVANVNKNHGCSIKYLLVPEMHKDGAWHIHGMIKGIPKMFLRRFNLEEKLPKYIRDKLKAGQEVFNWGGYAVRFGFCDLEYIRNNEATCKYIVKYITEDLSRSVTESHAKVYYCSQKLKRPEIVASGEFEEIIALPDFQNVYCMKKDFFDFASALEFQNVQFFDSFINAGFDDCTIQKILSA